MKRDLNKILDQIFKSTDDCLAEMARKSGLHYTTVRNLDTRATQFPRFGTVYHLAKAYGFTLELATVKKKMKRAA